MSSSLRTSGRSDSDLQPNFDVRKEKNLHGFCCSCIFSSEDTKPELKLNDVVQVVYDDGKLYETKLVRFDSTTNKYKVKYTNRQYGYEWTIVDRILKV
ncbi:unnamed protein product [Rotaria magnacalcarata]|uniref:Uncharacterized protein n=1 Tax=Rotaria magnacalcarata TaxID=392030 RepID=A0A816S913_9BILA|nr:unnamed protein product [Rotaria magnacalcarata]